MDMAGIVKDWLSVKSWPFRSERQQSRTRFEARVIKRNGPYRLELFVDSRQHFFGAYAYAPFHIGQEHHSDLLEIIARANWGHEFAQFELNPDTSQFRCSSTALLRDSCLTISMLEAMTIFILEWLDGFVPALREMSDQPSTN
jgi:hypothetical protein